MRIKASLRHSWIVVCLVAAGLSFDPGVQPSRAQQSSAPPAPAATVGAETITEADLDKAVGNQLLTIKSQEYALRRAVLEGLVQAKMLAAEAKRRGTTPEALARAEIDAKAQPVTDEEVGIVYDSAKDQMRGVSEADARRHIKETLARRRMDARRAVFFKELTARSNVRVLLDPPRVDVEPGVLPARGPAGAQVTIVEFSDYQCPYCARASFTLKQVMAKYPTQVRVLYRDFPLPNHPDAPRAAEAAHCAADQQKFWEMHDVLFENQRDLSEAALLRHAKTLALDGPAFASCLSSGKHKSRWEQDLDAGREYGVTATPAFFINGRFVNGALPLDSFAQIIEEELQAVKRGSGAAARQ